MGLLAAGLCIQVRESIDGNSISYCDHQRARYAHPVCRTFHNAQMHPGKVLLRNVAIVNPVSSGFGILMDAPTVIRATSGVQTWTIAKKAAATGSGG